MRLEALELVEGRQRRVLVVEMHDEADDRLSVLDVIEERSAAGARIERPSKRMLHETRPMARGVELPEFLQADAEFLRLAPLAQAEAGEQSLGERASRPFGEERVLAAQFHAAREGLFRLAIAPDTHVARGDSEHFVIGP